MKKLFFLASVMAAGMLLTGCSSDDVVLDQNNLNNKFDAQGNAYVNIAINTPSARATRANEVYDNGTPAEYDVKDAVLVLSVTDDKSDEIDAGGIVIMTWVVWTI